MHLNLLFIKSLQVFPPTTQVQHIKKASRHREQAGGKLEYKIKLNLDQPTNTHLCASVDTARRWDLDAGWRFEVRSVSAGPAR